MPVSLVDNLRAVPKLFSRKLIAHLAGAGTRDPSWPGAVEKDPRHPLFYVGLIRALDGRRSRPPTTRTQPHSLDVPIFASDTGARSNYIVTDQTPKALFIR
jgi:hypothetical protein